MQVEVNYFAVFLAMLSSMLVGAIWYSQSVFGTKWAKLVKLSDKQLVENAPRSLGTTVVVSLITAFVLAHISFLANHFYKNSFLMDSLVTAFWLWLGFTAARFITHDAFEQRDTKLTIMNIVHELVTLEVMALIIGFMKP